MSTTYFKAVDLSNPWKVSIAARAVLEKLIKEENIPLEKRIPLKVHFGEEGNVTYIKPECYEDIINFLKERGIESCFIETNVLYSSPRARKETHLILAKNHGFTQLPVVIADGERGEDYTELEINKKHFKSCKIGRLIAEEKQLIVLSHFKGHMLAGFGGAIKQLGMGCAARPGKLDQHANSTPTLRSDMCKRCKVCLSHCPTDAIELDPTPKINKKKCIGCAACIEACPNEAIGIAWMSTPMKVFRQKLAEYALAAHKKNNIYINFVLNITQECDCLSNIFEPIAKDLGVFSSLDPVALDKACLDMLNKKEKKKVFSGEDVFSYAEEIGLGSTEYNINAI